MISGVFFKNKNEHVKDFDYQQATQPNTKLVNSETNPGSVSRTFQTKSLKIQDDLQKPR
jgi:hypothetical protein